MPATEPRLEPRVVSLIASATEIVCELGLGRFLVGRSHECDFPPGIEKLPSCTRPRIDVSGDSREIDRLVKQSVADALSVYDVFDDALELLQPTHIVTQTQCDVCAVSLRDVELSVALKLQSKPRIVSLEPNCLADIWDDFRRVAASLNVNAEPIVQRLDDRLQALSERAHRSSIKPRVACIEWLEPLMAAGNWVPELVTLANGDNLFGEPGRHSPWMTWQELVEEDPDVLVVMPCGFPIDTTLREMHWITARPEYDELLAVRKGEVYVVDGNQFFNRPGPRVVESLQILVEILHGGGFSSKGLEGSGWVRFAPCATSLSESSGLASA